MELLQTDIKNSKMKKNSTLYAFAVLLIISCTNSNMAQEINNIQNLKNSKQIFTYGDNEIIEEFTFLGNLNLDKSDYRVYNCFRKIKLAQDYRGQSIILFFSKNDTLAYQLDSNEELPDSLNNQTFFLDGGTILIDKLSNPLCLHNGCYELEKSFRTTILSVDSFNVIKQNKHIYILKPIK
jgi:hypothetical protein